MGAWGYGPLENDNAADWFGDLMEQTGFRDGIAAGLESGYPDTVRAASWVLAQLGRACVWPIDSLDADRVSAGSGILTLLHDSDWLERWDSAAFLKASLRKQLRALELTSDELAQASDAAGVATPKKKATKKKATKKKATKKKATKKKATKKKATKKKTTRGWTRLEYSDAKSNKFWEIKVSGSSHTVRYGRLGTTGQEKTKSFESPSAAREAAAKLEAQKRKKGYS